MATYQDIVNQALAEGASQNQAETLGGLAIGCESGGNNDPAGAAQGSDASGYFQFLQSTWLANGGGAYAPAAYQASFADQVRVAVAASKNGFGAWGPDLASPSSRGDPNSSSNPNYSNPPPSAQPGSCAYNAIVNGGGTPGTVGGSGSGVPGGVGSSEKACLIRFPGVAGFGEACLFSKSQGKAVKGGLCIGAGALVMVTGLAVAVVFVFTKTPTGRGVAEGIAAARLGPLGAVRKAAKVSAPARRSVARSGASTARPGASERVRASRPGERLTGEEIGRARQNRDRLNVPPRTLDGRPLSEGERKVYRSQGPGYVRQQRRRRGTSLGRPRRVPAPAGN